MEVRVSEDSLKNQVRRLFKYLKQEKQISKNVNGSIDSK